MLQSHDAHLCPWIVIIEPIMTNNSDLLRQVVILRIRRVMENIVNVSEKITHVPLGTTAAKE